MVRELVRMMPEAQRESAEVKEIAGYGCGTMMHIIRLNAAPLEYEDYLRDIDFSPESIERRWEAGYADTRRTLAHKPWETPIDPMMGVAVFDSDGRDATSPVEKAS
jgi:NTE family protein